MIWFEKELTHQLLLIGEVDNNYIQLYLTDGDNKKIIKDIIVQGAEDIPHEDIRTKYGNVINRYVKKSEEQLVLLRHQLSGTIPEKENEENT
jgi:hypothetical protein